MKSVRTLTIKQNKTVQFWHYFNHPRVHNYYCHIFDLCMGSKRSLNNDSCLCTSLTAMEEHTLKIVNNCLNMNIYSYLETSDGQSSNLYSNVVHVFNTSVN